MQEEMDNLIDFQMIKEYLNGKIGSTNAQGEQQKIEYGTHLDIVKYINEKQYNLNMAGSAFAEDYTLDQLDSNGCWLVLKRPQEWSVSLAKAMCLSDEVFQ